MADFDPFAKLEEQTPADNKPANTPLDQQLYKKRDLNQRNDQMTERPLGVTATRPRGRKIVRRGTDWFEDQLTSFCKIQLEIQEKTGKKPTIGELAREAFDDLIKKKSH